MKTNKKLGFVAAALTALACALPNVARAAGDIWSIEPYQDAETVDRDFTTTQERPLSVGDVFKIRVRLLNRSWHDASDDPQSAKPWTFEYVGTPGGEPLARTQMPKLGVWVSGKLKFAELDGTPKPATPDNENLYVFTDIIFKYTVEPGDLALPLKLANPNGDGPIEADAPISGQYFLKNGRGATLLEDWQLKNGDGNECSLTFSNETPRAPLIPPMPNTAWDFSNPSIYIQAIDFDSNYANEEEGVWREIASGLTSSSPIDPAVAVPGGNAGTIDLYVWTKNSAVAEVVAGGDVLGVTTKTDLWGNEYRVGTIRVPATKTSASFKIKAASDIADQLTDVYLSTTPTNVYDMAQVVLTNFVTRTIKVVTPPPPFVSVGFAEGADRAVVADGNYAGYKTVLQVNLSQSFPSEVKVKIEPSVVNNAAGDPWKYIGLSQYDDEGVFLQRYTEVTISPNARSSAPIYVYALAADMWTRDLTNGIVFKATIEDPAAQAFFTGTPVDATLHIDAAKPVVTLPDAPYTGTSSIQSGETTVFSVGVSDSYANLTGVYDVYLNENNSFKGTESPIATNIAPVNGVLSVPYRFISTGLVTSRIKVRNAAGVESAVVSFEVNGLAPRALKGEPADGNVDKIYAEGKEAAIRAKFEPAFSLATEAYVFLEPQDEISSNKVTCLNFTRGVRIQNGQTETAVPIKLSLLDGTVATETSGLRYKLKIRTAELFDEGNEIEGYTSSDYNLFVTNVVPRVDTVYMGGIWQPELQSDGKMLMAGQAAVGVRKVFTYVPADGEVDADLTDTNRQFMAKWTFYDGAGYTTNVMGSPYGVEVPYTFVNGGRQRVTVQLQDKDLRDLGAQKFGETYTFYVDVVDTPSVELVPREGSQTFREDQIGDKGVINVRLTMAPDAPVKVQLEVKRNGTGEDNYPLPVLNRYELDFPRGVTQQSFNLKEIDGTEKGGPTGDGYLISARVITETTNNDGIRYCDLYMPATDFSIYISNVLPEIILPDPNDTNVYSTTLAKEEIIKWQVRDVCKNDISSGLKITIVNSDGASSSFTTTELSGEYTNKFTSSGSGKWVSVTVEDKDGGTIADGPQTSRRYFSIAAAKGVRIYPHLPQPNGQSSLADAYIASGRRTGGIGYGRVWAESNARPEIKNFRHLWSFTEGVSKALLHAYGYRTGEADNGTLNGGEGYGITSGGSLLASGGTPYVSPLQDKDSFFYAWILSTQEEGSESSGAITLTPQNGFAEVERGFPLPEDEEDAESYPDTIVEALFSREWRPADNMGDFNQDGIPDVYAVGAWDAGKLYELGDGQDAGAAAGETDTSDLKNAWKFNPDDDYLPAANNYPNPLKPTKPGWGPGLPFVAGQEIRGFHYGLNVAGLSEPDFSEEETLALMCDYVKSVAATGADADALADASTNTTAALQWAKTTGWNLERMTDPTVADSDVDGLPDGYEYFFWYYAKAGTKVGGTWQRLTGSRFNLATPGKGTVIPSEEIAEAFDPLVKHPEVQSEELGWDVKDFDGDGLTDLEEYYLGTNPCDWDSDGDGVSDYFEIMNGLDPLNASDGANGNPDGDFMAYLQSPDTFTVVRVWDDENKRERVFGYPVLEGGIKLAEATVTTTEQDAEGNDVEVSAPATREVWEVSVGKDETTYYLAEAPLLVSSKDKTYLAAEAKGWASIKVGKDDDAVYYLGAEVTLPVGTLINSVADEAAAMSAAVTTGFTGGLELFRYGTDAAGVWVPTAIDGQTLVQEFDMMGAPVEKTYPVLAYEDSVHIAYIHAQVYYLKGFDPRTAWMKLASGSVATRWDVQDLGMIEIAGSAENTRAYSNLDESLLLAYRYNVVTVTNSAGTVIPFRGKRDVEKDMGDITSGASTIAEIFLAGASKASPAKTGADAVETPAAGEDAIAVDVVTFGSDIHGADTDGDGIPDGWELYVNLDPNDKNDGSMVNDPLDLLDNQRTDMLTPVLEFAGVDSCNAYSNVPSIYQNHPGLTKGWWNKFFPTDPMNADTDGDGIADGAEGATKKGTFYCGRSVYQNVDVTFIYGTNTSYATDFATKCFRGGGLNPCTVDTDLDLLPDPWELEFAGVVFSENGRPVKAGLSEDDIAAMRLSDGMANGTVAKSEYISGGMDGTWSGDAYGVAVKDTVTDTFRDVDWDHDGLQNYQEYLVQSLRHLRYDDAETPLMGRYIQWGEAGILQEMPFIGFIPMQAWDGEAFRETCLKAGYKGSSKFDFAKLGYFARPPKTWDRVYNAGTTVCANYADAGYRIMLPPQALSADAVAEDGEIPEGAKRIQATGYASTDPRQWDSDNDGMDDYYELFHGLNPLLGSAVNPAGGNLATSVGTWGVNNIAYDRIAAIYVKSGAPTVTSWNNAWTYWDANRFAKNPTEKFDAIKYPWMIGTAECDADGDGINNADEALFANDTAPAASHTDPTPMWMTDSTSKNFASYVSQYYQLDPTWGVLADLGKLWDRNTFWIDGASDGQSRLYKFAFEENEGYDTDGDFASDATEKAKKIQAASDALNFSDPARRQAMWFPGEKSAVVSYKGSQLRPNSYEYDMLKQFTVEVWVCPEQFGTDQVIVERVAYYDASTLSNNVAAIRRNFRIGIDETGHVYGEFEGKTADSGSARVVCAGSLTLGKWTHVALSFDGQTLALYLDDNASPSASARGVSLIPANGVNIRLQESGTGFWFSRLENGYSTVPCAFLVGAGAADVKAMTLAEDTTWDSFGSFFKGYIDEIRVWDGARSGEDIAADCKTRYTFEDVAAARDRAYSQWANGAARFSATNPMDPELLQVYNFCALPGAVDPLDVVTEPTGFSQGVLDNVRVDGRLVDLRVGWWNALEVKSTVYNNYNIVPRIQNSVGHLPVYDGSAWDTEYWSKTFGGVNAASKSGYETFEFPNTANPYSSWNFCQERMYHAMRLSYLTTGSNVVANAHGLASKYEFDLRSGFVGTGDLVPLGGAFAKRTSEMWDGQGAADAWDQTGIDSDGDGLPDWWEYGVAMALYGAPENLTWSTVINYNGVEMTAAEAYIRDLAAGMLPSGEVDKAFSTTKIDVDGDGLPDWWQKAYGLVGEGPLEDADNDQLSNYAEYLISECFTSFGFPRVDATKTRTFFGEGQKISDYFLPVGKMYLGEMFSDHDFIEDWWEDLYDVKYASRFTFDGASDADEDGWSVFAEARAGTNPNRIGYLGVDQITVPDYPVPVVEMTAKYNGTQAVSDKNVIVQAYRMDDTSGKPDAVWQINVAGASGEKVNSGTQQSAAATTPTNAKLIGLNPNKEIGLTLGPGSVVAGTVNVQMKDIAFVHVESFVLNGVESVLATRLGGPGSATWLQTATDRVRPGDTVYGDIVAIASNVVSGAEMTQVIGSVNYQTGALELMLDKLTGGLSYNMTRTESTSVGNAENWSYDLSTFSNAYVKVTWTSKQAGQGFPQTFYLSDPESPSQYTSRGRLREGKNLFVAFIDVDGNGAWSAGEPYGVVADVDVGWSRVAPFCVEMTDTDPSVARIDLAQSEGNADFETVNALSDRGIRGAYYQNVAPFFCGTNIPIKAATRVRVVRSLVNGENARNGVSYNEVVLDRTFDLEAHPTLTEADVRADGKLDLDWGTLRTAWVRAHVGTSGAAQLTNATYRIVLGDGTVSGADGVLNNNLPILFVNAFESGDQQTAAAPVAPAGTVFAGQPTFSWTHDAVDATGKKVKDYPAFQLRVWKDKAMTSLVYDSGAQPAPARDAKGVYSWTAPIYADMVTPQGVVFATTNNYFWSVSMLDAKFTTANRTEQAQEFRMETSGLLGTLSDYGVIQAKVKYFGPATVKASAAQLKGMVRVQAFSTPDFTGMPAGEGWVTDVKTLNTTDALEVNAVILGVAPGTYYVRAFVDTDGDTARSAWESWGYANYLDTEKRNVYTPQPYVLKKGQTTPVVATVYIEDMDTDNDGLPDAYEVEKNGSLAAKSSPTGASFFTKVNPNLAGSVQAYTTIGASQASAVSQYAAMTFLSALTASDAQTLAVAGSLLNAAPAAAAETVDVSIASFSLTDGIEIAVGTQVAGAASPILSVADAAKVSVVLVASETPDFAQAKSVEIKDIVIKANAVTKELVDAGEIRKAIADNDLGAAAFFKVKLLQK